MYTSPAPAPESPNAMFVPLLAPNARLACAAAGRLPRLAVWTVVLVSSMGCRMGAPLVTWSPPQIASSVDRRLVLAPLAGPGSLAKQVESAVRGAAPRDAGRSVAVLAPSDLHSGQSLQLVSAVTDHPSDLALLPLARQQGVDHLLMGEVLVDPAASRDQDLEPAEAAISQGRLSVVWRLYDVAEARALNSRAVVVDTQSAIERYPDLSVLVADPVELLTAAAGRDTWRLMTPHLQNHRVQIALPWLTPGAAEVRRGNALAHAGRWSEAEAVWQQALDRHPRQHAAQHNLALAAAARQDFSQAKQLIRSAIRQRSAALYEQTLVWIERRQRDYHLAFGLPDPPEGWIVTSGFETPSLPTPSPQRQAPGWTWYGWMTQPIPLPWGGVL